MIFFLKFFSREGNGKIVLGYTFRIHDLRYERKKWEDNVGLDLKELTLNKDMTFESMET